MAHFARCDPPCDNVLYTHEAYSGFFGALTADVLQRLMYSCNETDRHELIGYCLQLRAKREWIVCLNLYGLINMAGG